MKITDLSITEQGNVAYDPIDLANIFNISERDDIGKFFNLNKTLLFINVDQLPPSLFQDYVVKEEDHWTLLASRFYKDVDLWWFICKFNNIMDPMTFPEAGTVIKIPTVDLKNLMMEGLS